MGGIERTMRFASLKWKEMVLHNDIASWKMTLAYIYIAPSIQRPQSTQKTLHIEYRPYLEPRNTSVPGVRSHVYLPHLPNSFPIPETLPHPGVLNHGEWCQRRYQHPSKRGNSFQFTDRVKKTLGEWIVTKYEECYLGSVSKILAITQRKMIDLMVSRGTEPSCKWPTKDALWNPSSIPDYRSCMWIDAALKICNYCCPNLGWKNGTGVHIRLL